MRVDVDQIVADVARERAARAYRDNTPILTDVVREERLLSDLVCWPELIDEHDELEVDDFSDFRNQALFAAMRKLQHAHGAFDLADLLDALDDHELLGHVGAIVHRYPVQLFERGRREVCAWLRELAQGRRQL